MSRVLWGAIALDGVIMIFLLLLYLPANRALSSVPWPTEPSSWLTPAEQWLRRLLVLLTVVFIVGAIGYEAAPLLGLAPDLVRELPFVTNSVVKVSTLAMLCGYVAQALRPRMALVGPIIAVHFVSSRGAGDLPAAGAGIAAERSLHRRRAGDADAARS